MNCRGLASHQPLCYAHSIVSLTTPKESSPLEAAEEAEESISPGKVERADLSTAQGLRVAIGSSFVLRLAGSSTGLLLSLYLAQVVHADANVIGILAAVFYATELALAPVFGALSDLRGRKPFLVLGPLAGAVAVQIHPLTTILAIIAIGRLLEGVSTAANTPGTLGYLADATSGEGQESRARRGRIMGLYEISFVIGLVGGNLLGGQLWELIGPNSFRLMSFIYLAAATMLFFFVPESLPAQARTHHEQSRRSADEAAHPVRALVTDRVRSYLQLLREPALRSFVPAWLAINAVVGLWFTHIAPLLVRPTAGSGGAGVYSFTDQLLVGRLSPREVGITLACYGAMFMVGIYIWSLLYARIRRTTILLISVVGLFIVCFVLLGINNNIMPGPFGQWPLVPLLVVGVLMESGFTPVALAYLADISEAHVEHRGVVMGLYSVFLGIGQLLGGGSGGLFIVGLGFNGLVLATLLLAVIAGGTVLWLRHRYGV